MADRVPPDVRIFYADTKFERKARSPGGISREKALQNASVAVAELSTDFSIWIDREVEQLVADLEQVSGYPASRMALEQARMICIQLRDVGDTMGYHLITYIATTFCSILEANIEGAPYDKSVADCHVAALKLGLTDEYRNRRPEEVPEMAIGLARISERTTIVPKAPGE